MHLLIRISRLLLNGKEQTIDFGTLGAKSSFVIFQPGGFDGEIQIKLRIKVSHPEAPSVSFYVNQLDNSEMKAGGTMKISLFAKMARGYSRSYFEGQGPDGINCTKITSIANPANEWDTQFFIYTPDKEWQGIKYKYLFYKSFR